MKTFSASLTVILSLGLASIASADNFSFSPNPVNLNDLDHHMVYTWRIDNVNLLGKNITSATLTFQNIRNWDTSPNQLYIHLLDTAINAGVASFADAPASQVPVTDMSDDFVNPRYHNFGAPGNPLAKDANGNPANWLVATGTADRFLVDPNTTGDPTRSFSTTAMNYTYTFTAGDLTALQSFIGTGNGDFAFGIDPDCHFFNTGITFAMATTSGATAVPEPGSFILLGSVLIGVCHLIRKRRSADSSTTLPANKLG